MSFREVAVHEMREVWAVAAGLTTVQDLHIVGRPTEPSAEEPRVRSVVVRAGKSAPLPTISDVLAIYCPPHRDGRCEALTSTAPLPLM